MICENPSLPNLIHRYVHWCSQNFLGGDNLQTDAAAPGHKEQVQNVQLPGLGAPAIGGRSSSVKLRGLEHPGLLTSRV